MQTSGVVNGLPCTSASESHHRVVVLRALRARRLRITAEQFSAAIVRKPTAFECGTARRCSRTSAQLAREGIKVCDCCWVMPYHFSFRPQAFQQSPDGLPFDISFSHSNVPIHHALQHYSIFPTRRCYRFSPRCTHETLRVCMSSRDLARMTE
jgi:hypothetical protein